jgi:hypothetical protein
VLNGMNQGQFKSILAHEYGHFVIHDTAGDILAFPVQTSMYTLREDLTRLSLTKWYNPTWLFYKGFTRIFLRITQGSSRLHESLADRHAALTYGKQNYVSGLTHIACQSILFRFQVDAEVNRANLESERLQNLYDLPLPPLGERRDRLKERLSKELQRPTRSDDSHLSLHDRIMLVERANAIPAHDNPDDLLPVWHLLPNASGLQEEMTAFVQANVDKQVGKKNQANNNQDGLNTLPQTILDHTLQ